MYVYQEMKRSIKQELEEATGIEVKEKHLDKPPEPRLGIIATNIAFQAAGKKGKNPEKEAQEIAEKINPEYISQINVEGPYINFEIDKEKYFKKTLKQAQKPRYGASNEGNGKTITIDYSHPNIAKPFHVGHLRSTTIGQALKNLYQCLGYRVIAINHLGDWGTQFGKLITAYKKWGNEEKLKENPIEHLYHLYVKFHEEAQENEELEDKARENFKKLEQGKKQETEIWEKFRGISIEEFKKTYERLGVSFDTYRGEAYYAKTGKARKTVEKALEKEVAIKEEEGAIVIPLEKHGLTNFPIQKEDGSTLYSTRDLAAARQRWEEYHFHENLYVVAAHQDLHFKQLFKSLELMGYEWSDRCKHISYGSVNLPEGSMSTRKGEIIKLQDFLDEAQERSLKAIEEKNPDLENKEGVADEVGKAAAKFMNLNHKRSKDIEFNWERALDFEGDTGPYLQYAHARANGIIEETKNPNPNTELEISRLNHETEEKLLRHLSQFPEKIKKAKDTKETQALCKYLLETTHRFNDFYRECPVKQADTKKLKKARLELVKAFKNTLAAGLKLLGITPLEEM